MKYDVDYFIQKFSAIPEELWCTQTYESQGQFCAYGHCGYRPYSGESERAIPECNALGNVFGDLLLPIRINDGEKASRSRDGKDYSVLGTTPKERIINALLKIKNNEPLT